MITNKQSIKAHDKDKRICIIFKNLCYRRLHATSYTVTIVNFVRLEDSEKVVTEKCSQQNTSGFQRENSKTLKGIYMGPHSVFRVLLYQ